jgi:hypothetical protein
MLPEIALARSPFCQSRGEACALLLPQWEEGDHADKFCKGDARVAPVIAIGARHALE